MRTIRIFLFAIAALGAAGVTTAIMSSAATAHAEPNPVSGFAQTNGNYQTGCMTGDTRKSCATGSGDNGDNTCGAALNFNGPAGGVQCGTQGRGGVP
jgi:invasion protein IalB